MNARLLHKRHPINSGEKSWHLSILAELEETVVTRKEFSLAKAKKVLKNETIAVIGYGVQAPAQALNMKDNGLNVIVGCRNHKQAKKDGWVVGKDLFLDRRSSSEAAPSFSSSYPMRVRSNSGPRLRKT